MHGALGCNKGKIIKNLGDKITAKWGKWADATKGAINKTPYTSGNLITPQFIYKYEYI